MTTPRPHIPIAPVADDGRRRLLKLMAASAALAGAGCSGPPAEQAPRQLAPPARSGA